MSDHRHRYVEVTVRNPGPDAADYDVWASVKTGTFHRSKVFLLVSVPAGERATARSVTTVSASTSASVRVDSVCRRGAP